MSDSLSPSYVSPPIKRVSPGEWIHKNLFSSWFNGFLTLISLLFIGWVGFNLIDWIFTEAQWQVITANLRLFLLVIIRLSYYGGLG